MLELRGAILSGGDPEGPGWALWDYTEDADLLASMPASGRVLGEKPQIHEEWRRRYPSQYPGTERIFLNGAFGYGLGSGYFMPIRYVLVLPAHLPVLSADLQVSKNPLQQICGPRGPEQLLVPGYLRLGRKEKLQEYVYPMGYVPSEGGRKQLFRQLGSLLQGREWARDQVVLVLRRNPQEAAKRLKRCKKRRKRPQTGVPAAVRGAYVAELNNLRRKLYLQLGAPLDGIGYVSCRPLRKTDAVIDYLARTLRLCCQIYGWRRTARLCGLREFLQRWHTAFRDATCRKFADRPDFPLLRDLLDRLAALPHNTGPKTISESRETLRRYLCRHKV